MFWKLVEYAIPVVVLGLIIFIVYGVADVLLSMVR